MKKLLTMSVILGGIVLVGAIPPRKPATPKARQKPNIVLIMADDMGYSDLAGEGTEFTIQLPSAKASSFI